MNDFDGAKADYEQILSEDPENSEAYWGVVLCRYGVTYVKSPDTGKLVPTVNRTQFASVFDDDDYKLAIEYANDEQRAVYKSEGEEIERIRQEILNLSSKEAPFDVFICYKQADERGNPTQDSKKAHELYNLLTDKGYKVFFSKITLEDKLGENYEPYIFSALNTARVMVAIGSQREYYNAPWVKNEWSRFLNLAKTDRSKRIIPAYMSMTGNELPMELRGFQGVNLSAPASELDLVRSIEKYIGFEKPKEAPTPVTVTPTVTTPTEQTVEKIKLPVAIKAIYCLFILLTYAVAIFLNATNNNFYGYDSSSVVDIYVTNAIIVIIIASVPSLIHFFVAVKNGLLRELKALAILILGIIFTLAVIIQFVIEEQAGVNLMGVLAMIFVFYYCIHSFIGGLSEKRFDLDLPKWLNTLGKFNFMIFVVAGIMDILAFIGLLRSGLPAGKSYLGVTVASDVAISCENLIYNFLIASFIASIIIAIVNKILRVCKVKKSILPIIVTVIVVTINLLAIVAY